MAISAPWQLAQVNIGRIRAPMSNPVMAEFAAALAEINALAESSPGFVWRLKDASGDATSIQAFSDPLMLVNLSVWTNIEALKDYVYRSAHGRFFARRRDWFESTPGASFALWWIPVASIPTVEDAKGRLALLDERGPTPLAFTFKQPFPPPGSPLIA
jgi:hypothetical protein